MENKRRIVKETLVDGTVRYRVEESRFGILWRTAIMERFTGYGYGGFTKRPAVFDCLENAVKFCSDSLLPLKREVL